MNTAKKRKSMTAAQEDQWAEAGIERQRGIALTTEATAEIAASPNQWINDKYRLGRKLTNNADRVQDSIIALVQCFHGETELGSANMVVWHYQDIIGSGKCIGGNHARNKCDAIDAEFMALYPSSETDEYLPLVKALGDAAWGGYVQLLESSPRYDYTPPTSANGRFGYFTNFLIGTECLERLLSLAIHLCLRSRVCAEVLLDCATTHGATDELYYKLLGYNYGVLYPHSMITLLQEQPTLLGQSPALALGCAHRCMTDSAFGMEQGKFRWFAKQVKTHPEWFSLPTFVRNLVGHAFADVGDAARALRILACLDAALLKREAIDLGHLIDALKGNKAHMKRVEALVARVENPGHMDMAAEREVAFGGV